MTTLLSSALILICNIVAISADCRNSYTSLPAGKTTYDIDDGGCFFCSTKPHAYETLGYDAESSDGAIPLLGKELNEHCESLCNADSKCIAYTVARPATLAADEYLWGKSANCCLDRMEAPEELYVDANDIDVLDDEEGHNNCQLGAMCWTRFERDVTGCTEEELLLEGAKLNGSDQCTMVWKVRVSIVLSGDRTYTPDELSRKIRHVKHGCNEDSETYEHMLHEAYDICKAEVDQELGNLEQFEEGE